MADAAVISLMHTIDQILKSDRFQNYEWTEQLRSVHETASVFQSFLEHASQRNIEEVEHFERQIKDVACELEDVIELIISNAVLSESGSSMEQYMKQKEGRSGIQHATYETKGYTRSCFPNFRITRTWSKFLDGFSCYIKEAREPSESRSLLKQLRQTHKEAQRLTKEIGHISEEVTMTQVTRNLKDLSFLPASSSRASSGNRSTMVGFNEDLIKIMDRLTGYPSKLQIIPIVGMAGIGKTTLAKALHEDPLIKEHFQIRAWTTVSQEYSFQDTILGLLGEKKDEEKNENLGERLYKLLKGKRYLVVLDDVWDNKVWDDFWRIFPDVNNGSRIILTTRMSIIGTYVNSLSSLHKMRLLNHDESWNLLQKKVFSQEQCPPELEKIGRAIAENCQGLPLAIVVIGGLLANSARTREYWKYVASNVNSSIALDDDHWFEILSLSYKNLPPHLKPCFLYMGVFPEGHMISISRLIKLWIAEGFLKPVTSASMEEVARHYVQDLVDRNLILVDELKSDGRIKSCKLHDLLRELCVREAQKQKFFYVINRKVYIPPRVTYGQRRLSINPSVRNDEESNVNNMTYEGNETISETYEGSLQSMSLCRSFVSHSDYLDSLSIFVHFRLVRILNLTKDEFSEFPVEILQLVNLRFLGLKCSGEIPSSISIFWHLQTLIIYGPDSQFHHLPPGIWKLSQLKHLHIPNVVFPKPSPGDDSLVLENLETLSRVCGRSFTEEIYKRLPNLKKVSIGYYREYGINSSEDYRQYHHISRFVHLDKVQSLSYNFYGNLGRKNVLSLFPDLRDIAITGINFSLTLKQLLLNGCSTPWEEMTVIGSLPNLEVLKLLNDAFAGPEWETNEGEFCRLKYLKLQRMSLKYWRADSSHFPCLRQLVLCECLELEEIPSGIGEIPTLEVIETNSCSESIVNSVEEILEEHRSLGNEYLQHISKEPVEREFYLIFGTISTHEGGVSEIIV